MAVSMGECLAEHRVVMTILTSRPEAWHGRSRCSQTGYPPRGRVCSPLMTKKAGSASKDTHLAPRPPSFSIILC